MSENKQEAEPKAPHPENVDTYDFTATGEELPETKKEEVTPDMQKAIDSGWSPKDSWRGDPNEWVDFGEFNRRGEIFNHLKSTKDEVAKYKSEVDELKAVLTEFQKVNEAIINKEHESILSELERQKAEAIQIGDGEAVINAEKKIEDFKASKNPPKANVPDTEEEAPVDPVIVAKASEFEARNPWYATEQRVAAGDTNVDWEMSQIADSIGIAYVKEQKLKTGSIPPPDTVLQRIESRLAQLYPDKFNSSGDTTSRESPPNVVEPTGEVTARKRDNARVGTTKISDFDPDKQRVIRRMADLSNVSVDEYIQKLEENNALQA